MTVRIDMNLRKSPLRQTRSLVKGGQGEGESRMALVFLWVAHRNSIKTQRDALGEKLN